MREAGVGGAVGRFTWRLKEIFGAEILGDTAQPVTEAEQRVLFRLLYEEGFLEFKDQRLTKAEFRCFCGHLAPLLPEEHEANPILAVDPGIGGFGTGELWFHRDLSYAEHPFQAIALHALDVNPDETGTLIASNVLAYRNLPAKLKKRLAGLQVITALGKYGAGGPKEQEVSTPGHPRCVHPLVGKHPITGRPILNICTMSSVRIESMAYGESEGVLQELFGYLDAENNTYEHRWHNGDLLSWDNYGAVHARKAFPNVTRRTLQRLTMGKLSFPMAFPNFSMRGHTNTLVKENYMGNKGGRF